MRDITTRATLFINANRKSDFSTTTKCFTKEENEPKMVGLKHFSKSNLMIGQESDRKLTAEMRKYSGSKSNANEDNLMSRSYFDDSGIDARDSSVSPGERRTSTESFSPGSSSSENGSREMTNVIDRRSKIYSTLPPLEIKVNNNRMGGKWKYMQKDQEKSHFTDYDVFLTLADSQDKERGFGFTLKGGRERREFLNLETVLKNSPADKAGLQIGDQLLEVDGEDVVDQCLSKVNPVIREAMRLGDLELRLRRRQKNQDYHQEEKEKSIQPLESTAIISPSSPRSEATFDQKRSIFEKNVAENAGDQQNRPAKSVAAAFAISRHRKFGGSFTNNCYNYSSSYGGSFRDNRRSYNNEEEKNDVVNCRKIDDQKPAIFVIAAAAAEPAAVKKIAPVYSTPTRKDLQVENFAAAPSSAPQFLCVVNKPPAPPGTDYKVTSLHEEKFVGKITDFLPEIERDHRFNHHHHQFVGKKLIENLSDMEKDSPGVEETDSQLQDSKILSQSSNDVANIRKSFEQRIEREKGAFTSAAVPLPSTVHYSHLAFPRDKAQAAYVVSRALAPKMSRGLPAASSSTVYQRVQKRIDQQEQENLEKENKQQHQQEKQINEYSMEKEEYGMIEEGEDLKLLDNGVSDSDEKLGVTSVKRYDQETMPPVPTVRATRSKSVSYQSTYAKENTIFKDSTKVKSSSITSASPYRKQQNSAVGSSTSGSSSPAPPSRKISSASLYETPPISRRRATDSSSSFSSVNNMSPVEKAEMLENRRKLSAADRQIESVEKLANQILEEKSPPVLLDKNDKSLGGGDAKALGGGESYSKTILRPPSPKFPTNDDDDADEARTTKDRPKKDNDKRICSKCSTKIGNGAAMAIDSLDMIFHLSCFTCDSCGVRLGDGACGTDVRVVAKRLMCQICYENEIM